MVLVHDALRSLGRAARPATVFVLITAVLVTAASSLLGLDAAANEVARGAGRVVSIAWSAPPMLFGLAVPVIVPAILLWRRGRTDQQARAVLAAVLAGLAVNLVLKGLTGRTSPEAMSPANLLERSQSFAFGFLRGGVWEGWPSGHAMTNTALAAGLWTAFPSPRVRAVALGWAAWVLLAVVFGIQGEVHWLSDGVAGAMLGWWFGGGSAPSHRLRATRTSGGDGERPGV